MSIEKRKFPRIDMVFKVKYASGHSMGIPTISRDLSFNGVAFETETLLEPGESIQLKISFEELPGEIPAGADIVRTWSENGKNFAAVVFTELEDEDQTIIEEYLGYYEEGIING